MRTQYLYRKGISGDWANQFDGEAALNFHQGFGGIMHQWNYESNGEWARANARYKSADRLPARAKLGNLLGKRNSNTVQA